MKEVLTIKYQFKKETPGKYRYSPVDVSSTSRAIGDIYVAKWMFKDGPAESIVISMRVPDNIAIAD